MEHSALHALQLSGMVIALGGPILMLGIFLPALKFGTPASGTARSVKSFLRAVPEAGVPLPFAAKLEASVARWVFGGASLCENSFSNH
ncbi:MAG TPA: hypothetical protein VF437_04955 [Verrucomicrobiae bacterium]|jgi:hypothetical protein